MFDGNNNHWFAKGRAERVARQRQFICQMRLRSVVGERGKWSEGRRGAHSESKPKRIARREPQTEARRVCGTLRMLARDERAILRSGTGAVERERGPTGSPWNGGKPRVGHGD